MIMWHILKDSCIFQTKKTKSVLLILLVLLGCIPCSAPKHTSVLNTSDVRNKLNSLLRNISLAWLKSLLHEDHINKTFPPYIPATNRRKVRFSSKTRFFLEILPTGKVAGHPNKTNYSMMELQVINAHVKRIKSIATGKFLAINQHGKVVTTDNPDITTLLYEEQMDDYSTTYSSLIYPKHRLMPHWYIGLYMNKKRKAKVRRGSRTLPGDSATHFFISYER